MADRGSSKLPPGLALAAMVAGMVLTAACAPVSVDLDNRPCDDSGACAAGYVCHPETGRCGTELDIGCDDEGQICPRTLTTGEPCPSAGAFVPCRAGETGCEAGCRTCSEGLRWSECSAGTCTLGTITACATCRDDCTATVRHATPACDDGGSTAVCSYTACASGWVDADGLRQNGCEASCLTPADDTCDGADNDCNGTIDDVAEGDLESQCDALAPASGVTSWTCTEGACAVEVCDAGLHDLDDVATNGCEYACAPSVPPAELCDDQDNDCDGEVDDIHDVLTVCAAEYPVSQAVVVWACVEGGCEIIACQDGKTDADQEPSTGCEEDCLPTTPGPELCDGEDNDCNGFLDDVLPAALRQQCAAVYPLADDVAAWRCASAACAIGTCAAGTHDADDLPATGCEYACTPTVPAAEICDGVDNDCDGDIDGADTDLDEEAELDASCAAQNALAVAVDDWGCIAGACEIADCAADTYDDDLDPGTGCEYACAPSAPGAEICDGADNDCDGDADAADTAYVAATDCGPRVCTSSCAQVLGWSCTGGACRVTGCTAGRYDADRNPTTGCEYACTPTASSIEICDGADNDCDGQTDAADVELDVAADCLARICTASCAEVKAWACDGVCAVDACDSGHVDLDADPRTGCEYACAPTTPGPDRCDGEDNDCDPATADGSGEATFADDCDGADAGVCEEGMLACNGTSLFCTDATGDDVEGPFPDRSCVGTVDEDCDGLLDLADPGCTTGYGYRRSITIAAASVSAACSTALPSFPVPVRAIGVQSFRTTTNGGRLHSPSAFDLTFWAVTDAVCGAGLAPCKLDHELERWSGLTGDLVAWVRLPSLRHDAPTTFYVYYGRTGVGSSPQNAPGVWEPNFVGVWHLGETSGGSSAIRDSTSNANHATDVGSPSLAQAGKLGNAVSFDGSASYLRVADGTSLHLAAEITIEAWVYPDTTKAWATVASKFSGTTTGDLYWVQNTNELDGVLEPLLPNSAGGFMVGALPIGAWSYVALSYNGATARQMVNGTQVDSASVTGTLNLGSNTNPLYIGHNAGWSDEKFDGRIDEVRISRVGRGPCWMETSFNSQNDPGTFASLGAEEAL